MTPLSFPYMLWSRRVANTAQRRTLETIALATKDAMPPPDSARRSAREPWSPRLPAHAVDEGVLVARSALRLAVKNRVIMTTLRDGAPWNDAVMTELARREIEALIDELSATATRLEASSATRQRTFGRPRRVVSNLRQDAEHERERARILRGVVERLRILEEDPEQTRALLAVAREETLTELTQARLIPSGMEQTEEERRASIDAVKNDLLALLAQRELQDLPDY